MPHSQHKQLVFTIKDRCRVCFTCVRECPVKAIRMINGQAEVINERCIGCGNCVKVCSQGAKVFLNTTDKVNQLLHSNDKVAAIVAPSYPADFINISPPEQLIGMIRALGFDYVNEVAFGADLVAKEYDKILDNNNMKASISSDCPAIVFYIEQYHPHLVRYLAPVVSPMVATARILRKKHGNQLRIVFIGPCIAKKAESDEIDEVITFLELRDMLRKARITPHSSHHISFDPPFAAKGAIFPVSRGLLQTLHFEEDIAEGNIVVAEGRINFKEAIHEFENGFIRQHLELLCCEGCIMGPGMSKGGKRYARRNAISQHVRNNLKKINHNSWLSAIEYYSKINLKQTFTPTDRRLATPHINDIEKVLQTLGKHDHSEHLNCGACGYDTCQDHAIAIVQGLAEDEMCLPYTIEKLHHSIAQLNETNQQLASAKEALHHSEKLANMGQLSAGIAHELNNPLGIITMYSNILIDEIEPDTPFLDDLKLIAQQADRCKKIVGGLLNFARKNQVNLCYTNMIELVENSINTILHSPKITISFQHQIKNPYAMVDRDQITQVLTNLEKNAIEALPDSGGELSIKLTENSESITLILADNGCGISQENMEKIFTPFFTTKDVGKGTGLGLPLIYGIVKMHKGTIDVSSNANIINGHTGTQFKITLPRRKELIKDTITNQNMI